MSVIEWIDHAAESEMREKNERAKTPIFEHTILPPHTQHKYLQFISKIRKKNVKPRQRYIRRGGKKKPLLLFDIAHSI